MSSVIVVFIGCDNHYLKSGLVALLESKLDKKTFVLSASYSDASLYISAADYIFFNINYNVHTFCVPSMLERKANSVVFGINGEYATNSLCMRDMLYLDITQDVCFLELLFCSASGQIRRTSTRICDECKFKYFSKREKVFFELFMENSSMLYVSRTMECSLKTAYAYKNNIKKKFALHSDSNFFNFIRLCQNNTSFLSIEKSDRKT